MLDKLDEDLERFDQYLDLTEPSGDGYFQILYIKFWCFKNWSIELFCDLARGVLSIFSRNDLQRLNVSWA